MMKLIVLPCQLLGFSYEKEILLIVIIFDSSGFAFDFVLPFFFFSSGLEGAGEVSYLIKGLKTAAVEYILYPQTKAEYGAVPCNACKHPFLGTNSQLLSN